MVLESEVLKNGHKALLFDFDKTLVNTSSIEVLANGLGFTPKLADARKEYYAKQITERVLTRRIAAMLKGTRLDEFNRVASQTPKQLGVHATLDALRLRCYRLGVVSFAFRQTIDAALGKETFHELICPVLQVENGVLTGKVQIPEFLSADLHVFCKGAAAKALMRHFNAKPAETIAVGDSRSDRPLLMEVAVPVEIHDNEKILPHSIKIKRLLDIAR